MKVSEEFMINPESASKDEIQEALALLAKKKERAAKIARGEIKGDKKWSEMTDEEKEKARARERVYQARRAVMLQKAQEAGITVTDEEVEEYLLEKGKL